MRTNVFSKTSSKQAGGTGRNSTASGFPSQMGYPTGGSPVQLLKKGDFASLDDLGFDVDNWEDFEFQLLACRNNPQILSDTHTRLSAIEVTEENRADIAKAKDLVSAAMHDAKRKAVADPQAAATMAAAPSETTSASTASQIQSDAKDTVEAATAAALRLTAAFEAWTADSPLPAVETIREWIKDIRTAGEKWRPRFDVQRLLYYLTISPPTPENVAHVCYHMMQIGPKAINNPAVMGFVTNTVASMPFVRFQQFLDSVSKKLGLVTLPQFINLEKTIGARVAATKTTVNLHMFEFPGFDKSRTATMVAAASKFYQTYGINIQVGATTTITVEQAKQLKLEDDSLFWGYTARFDYGKGKGATDQKAIISALPPQAGMVGVYAFGAFNNLNPNGHAIGVTIQPNIDFRSMDDSIFLGPGSGYDLTLAHELGHLLGGHVGGDHREEKDNLMFKSTNEQQKRIDLIQMLFFKSSPFANEDKKDK